MARDPFPWTHGEEPDDPLDPIGTGWRDSPTPSKGSYPGQAILGAGPPRAVLQRLIDGDPLEIQARCVEGLREQALLISVERAHLRAVARVAYAAPRYRGEPPLDQWLGQRIAHSLSELIAEEREEERGGIPADEPANPLHAYLGEALGLEIGLVRRACVALHRLETDVRRVFFAVVVDRKTLNRYVADGNGPPSLARERLKTATGALRAATGWDGRTREGRPYDGF